MSNTSGNDEMTVIRDSLMPTADEKIWHVVLKTEQQVGPVGMEEIGQYWDAKKIDKNSLVWMEGMPEWQPMHSVQVFEAFLKEHTQQDTGTKSIVEQMPKHWQPSVANALSSLAQEEMVVQKNQASPHDVRFAKEVDAPIPAIDWSKPASRSNRQTYHVILACLGVVMLVGLSIGATFLWMRYNHKKELAHKIAIAKKAPMPVAPPVTAPVAAQVPTLAPPAAAAVKMPELNPKAVAEDTTLRGRRRLKNRHQTAATSSQSDIPPVEHVKSNLEMKDVWSTVRKNASKISPCLKAARSKGQLDAGKYTFVLDWNIRPDGTVYEPHLKGPETIMSASLASCFANVMEQWVFPSSELGAPVRNFPFGPVNVP